MPPIKRGSVRLLDSSTFGFLSGQTIEETFDLPTTSFVKRYWLNLVGDAVLSAVVTPPAVHSDGPVNLIQQVDARIDGKPWKLASGAALFRISQRYDQTDGVNLGLLGGAAGTYPFQAMIPILAEMPSSVNPLDSLLDGRPNKKLNLAITFGTSASLFVGGSAVIAINNCRVELYVEETDIFPVEGPFWLHKQREAKVINVQTASGTRLIVPINKGAVMRSIQLRAVDGSDLSDTVMETFNLSINGGEVEPIKRVDDDAFQGMAKHAFGSDVDPDGYVFIELAENGRVLTTGLGANGAEVTGLDVLMDTVIGAGATSIIATITELEPPRGTDQ